jgi:phosphoribosyl-AMP cyclohydrolase / phosphoribosyl-ATP pyrophosphohydrolase
MTDTQGTDRGIRSLADLGQLRFSADGLIPVVAQAEGSGAVLMVAWADRSALEKTLESGQMHYWSRSRQALWRKGETSGHTQEVVSLHTDCDGDTLLAVVRQIGPACHTGEPTCFGAGASPPGPGDSAVEEGLGEAVAALWATLLERNETRPEGSYTARLLGDENLRLKKLGEETVELVTAVARRDPAARIAEEGVDLVYHLLVAMVGAGVPAEALAAELRARRR